MLQDGNEQMMRRAFFFFFPIRVLMREIFFLSQILFLMFAWVFSPLVISLRRPVTFPCSSRSLLCLPSAAAPPPAFICPSFFRVTFRATQTESKPVWGSVELTSLKAPAPPSLPILPTINMKKSIKVLMGS